MIEVEHLEKTFKVLNRKEGLKGAFADLFSRDYKYIKAVDDISFHIDDGEIMGYVGPNGAGKSTTIKMMTGILQPTSGSITINGRNPYDNRREHMRKIGVVFGQRSQLWWSLPVIESFKVLKDIYQVSDSTYKNNLALFESLVNIKELYSKPVRQMSLGQRMLCEVVAAFLHDPEVVFLDEPTIGLDVAVKDSIRELIKHLNRVKNTSIILTSHDTKDIEALCERVAIIDKGRMIFDDSLNQLKQMFGKYRTIHFELGSAMDYNTVSQIIDKQYPGSNVKVEAPEDAKDKEALIIVNEHDVDFKQVMGFVINSLQFDNIGIEDVGVEEVIKRIYEGGVAGEQAV